GRVCGSQSLERTGKRDQPTGFPAQPKQDRYRHCLPCRRISCVTLVPHISCAGFETLASEQSGGDRGRASAHRPGVAHLWTKEDRVDQQFSYRDEQEPHRADRVIALATSLRYDRRQILKRAAAFGLSAPAIAAVLAACGGDDDDEDPAPTEASGGD